MKDTAPDIICKKLHEYIGITCNVPYLIDSPIAKLCGSDDWKDKYEYLKKINYPEPDPSRSLLLERFNGDKGMSDFEKDARDVFRLKRMEEYVEKLKEEKRG